MTLIAQPLVRLSPLVARPPMSPPVHLRLVGEHDIATVAADEMLLAGATEGMRGEVVLDLSEVTFLSAATIGVIVHARRVLAARGRTLVLRAPSASARRVLDICDIR